MKSYLALSALLLSGLLLPALAQQSVNSTATCTFQDGKEMSIQYDNSADVKNANLSSGKLWSPGKKPMVLFTQTDLTIGNSQIPVGAYSVYLIPGKDRWTLVINKNVKPGEYNPQQDLVRAPMDVAQISAPQPFSVVFAHMAPKQCNIRLYEAKTGAWAEFHEK
jgi:Protein of unknown function (DUF2911)